MLLIKDRVWLQWLNHLFCFYRSISRKYAHDRWCQYWIMVHWASSKACWWIKILLLRPQVSLSVWSSLFVCVQTNLLMEEQEKGHINYKCQGKLWKFSYLTGIVERTDLFFINSLSYFKFRVNMCSCVTGSALLAFYLNLIYNKEGRVQHVSRKVSLFSLHAPSSSLSGSQWQTHELSSNASGESWSW